MFETRSQAWAEVGLQEQVSPRALERARVEALVLAVLFVAVVVALLPSRLPVRRQQSEDAGGRQRGADRHRDPPADPRLGDGARRRPGLAPALFRRMDPATAGTVGFLIRLVTSCSP